MIAMIAPIQIQVTIGLMITLIVTALLLSAPLSARTRPARFRASDHSLPAGGGEAVVWVLSITGSGEAVDRTRVWWPV